MVFLGVTLKNSRDHLIPRAYIHTLMNGGNKIIPAQIVQFIQNNFRTEKFATKHK
jgi:hypothetical protein